MGPSGSGKSTFLHVAAGLDAPTTGSAQLGGVDLAGSSQTALTVLRRERVGFVFQAFNLMASLTVEENIGLPVRLGKGRLTATGCARSSSARAWPTGSSTARAAVGRPAAARRDRAGARHAPRRPVRRRAHRRAGHHDRPRGARTDAPDRRRDRADRRHGHPRPVAAAHADRVVFLADGKVAGFLDSPTPEGVADRMTHLGS